MRSALVFFGLVFAVSWPLFVFAANSGPAGANSPVLLLGVFAPAWVALAVTALADGRGGLRQLLHGLTVWPTAARWYVFAVAYMVTIKLTAAIVHRVAMGLWPTFGGDPWYAMAAATLISAPVQAGEEIGWRGYALPRLATRLGLGPASVVLGLVWAVWHLPLFYNPISDTFGQSFPVYALNVVALSVAIGWLYWRTLQSLPLVMLLHAAINNTKDVVPSAAPAGTSPWNLDASPVAWITALLLWTCAAAFLVNMRRATLEAPQPQLR